MLDAATKERMLQVQIRRLESALRHPDNRECFDCTALQPRWASTNLGIFLCMRCAGIHRSLGTHISKVKSVSMDVWDEHMIVHCENTGNANAKRIYEANLPKGFVKPSATSDTRVVERVTRQKFEQQLWIALEPPAATPSTAASTGGVVQGSLVSTPVITSPAKVLTGAVSAGGATISRVPQPPAQSPVPPTAVAATTPATPAPVAAAIPSGTAAKPSPAVDWGDFFGSPTTATPTSTMSSAASQQQLVSPTATAPSTSAAATSVLDIFSAPISLPAGRSPGHAPTLSGGNLWSSTPPTGQSPTAIPKSSGADPFASLRHDTASIGSRQTSAVAPTVGDFFGAPTPVAVTVAAPRNTLDDLFG